MRSTSWLPADVARRTVNFLLDDDIPNELSCLLEHLGHRISRVREVLPGEASDDAVLDYAFQQDLIVITCKSR